jgi:hypothetical protein
MEVTFTYTRDDEMQVRIRAVYHRASRDTFSAPGTPPWVEVCEANEGDGWVPIEHVDGLDADNVLDQAWDAVESKLARFE